MRKNGKLFVGGISFSSEDGTGLYIRMYIHIYTIYVCMLQSVFFPVWQKTVFPESVIIAQKNPQLSNALLIFAQDFCVCVHVCGKSHQFCGVI